MGIFGAPRPSDALLENIRTLTETMQRLSAEIKSMQGNQAAHGAAPATTHTHTHEGTCSTTNGHDALSHGADHGHHHISLSELALPYFHMIIDSLNIIGVMIFVVTVVAVLPTMFMEVLPSMFARAHEETRKTDGHGHGLHVRIMLSRGIMLGLDFMVGADIIETLCGSADIIKIMCIVAIRSFLAWERGKEMTHMEHEIDHWKKAKKALLKEIGGGQAFYEMSATELAEKTQSAFKKFDSDESGEIDFNELKDAMVMMGVQCSQAELKKMVGAGNGMSYPRFHEMIVEMSGAHS